MNGSSAARSTPAKARNTGKPSPSKPRGAVVTDSTGRWLVDAGSGTAIRGRTVRSSTVMAGIRTLFPGDAKSTSIGDDAPLSELQSVGALRQSELVVDVGVILAVDGNSL